MDHVTSEVRSRIMAAVKSVNTGPELAIRRALHRLGYRYSLHAKDLPGSPDIVFRNRKKVIYIHGCFWHGHRCSKGRPPKSNKSFWIEKISKNQIRDRRSAQRLRRNGWSVMTIWSCQIKKLDATIRKIIFFLNR